MPSLGSIRRSFTPWDDPGAKPYISFQNVTKRFGSFVAVENLSLDVYEREFFSLLGPSGCGKTTLLRMLAGFEEPTEGELFLDGQPLKGVPPHKRPVNMMFQSYALFPHMSVADNIAFGLKQDGMEKAARDERVQQMLKLVKLEEFARRKPHQLSGGQRQRVALARSVAKRPKLLILDEPLGALDKKLREETQFELMDLQQELGLTFMIVTHDQEEAMTMSDRIAVMDKGIIVQTGTPVEIYEAPNSRYVADFIGSVNTLEGKVESSNGDRVVLDGPDGKITGALREAAINKGATAWFAIRPEKIGISRTRPEGAVNAFEGEVWDIAYLGDMTVLNVKLGSGAVVQAAMLNRFRLVEEPIGYDERVWLTFGAESGIVLDR
ncbi:spermidine/putrescine ABC transporter ATP-binding subunit [Hoeflea halophila]|uniref:Spermidine/putrescine import ATP-binding protein PotA n=1 Tax=Hoeflea halophila TaxID=714899 RepID=A0A286IEK7_9HYPH|nr:ABC transporter ATP-binding protein [Hoeflea halophila]SOE18550.1 spermidine/putrescine ABC transporter ATP-binding subunit [Hoeflea halophila]